MKIDFIQTSNSNFHLLQSLTMTYISQNWMLSIRHKAYADLLFQRVNVNNSVIELCKRFLGGPQGSIFVLLLFKIFITGISSL